MEMSGQKEKQIKRLGILASVLVLLMVLILGFVSQDAFEGGQWGKGLDLGNFKWLFSGYGLAAVGYASMPAF